ncbi:MAG: hypothetical protein Q8M92_10395, partial [Candidatus Subteraquimicrobiales bacterium]|nr:hypothetical protein [Candidatus Subteraquimicrobiales bacterium]
AILWVLIYRSSKKVKEKHYEWIISIIIWIISIILISYSFILGELLWGLIAVLQIAILWVLIYRSSKKVKEKHYDYSKRPIGITVLAALYAYTIFSGILGLITEQSAIIFGVTLSGISAQLVYVIFILIGVYLTYGFIKLLRLAWIIAIIFGFYGLLNISINIIFYGSYMSFFSLYGFLLKLIIIGYILGKADYFRN